MKWFKKGPRAVAKAPAPGGPAIATGSTGPGDTEARLEHSSALGADFTEERRGPRPPAPPAVGLSVPSTLGRYEVRRLLGAGGFGAVYLGHDGQLDRPVAIKVLRTGARHRADPERARQEARRLAQLHHPGIVAVHDIGVHDGAVYIVSEYLEGTDLRSWMHDHRASWQEATRIAMAVLEALGHAHARRVIHRDIKPANIIFTTERVPVLVDFGIALSDEQAGAGEKGILSGTPHYMSPEQARGLAHRIDGRTDLYSLGVVLYELLTGRPPFQATDLVEVLRQVRDDEPQPPRQLVGDLPPDLERVCLKALAKRQQDRYTTAADFADDLQRVIQAAVTPGASGPAPVNPAVSPATLAEAPTTDAMPQQLHVATPTPFPAAADMRTPSSVRRAREAERRQLTVLVCGCAAFESEPYLALDSEDQAPLLRAFLETCDKAVQQFGGTIVESSERGAVACFGFPLAYEDAAGRAARAGLAILEGMTIHSERFHIGDSLPLNPWVGIHTGAAVVEAKADVVSLVGEARNVAVRLEDVAVAGQVICTEGCHRLFQGRFHCASLGRQAITGVPGPIELFRVEHVALAGSPIDAVAPAELSPLTGRDQEVGLLMDRWEQAKEGMGQVVLLIGEPGLGKSRLVHTMKQHVLGQMVEGAMDAPVIEWRCSPHFQNTGLYPAIDFYERALAFDREVAPSARFDRMLHRLEQYDLARPETIPLWASLLSLPIPDRYPPLALSPVRQREETFRAMLDWLHTRAARKPVLFIVEDLHWVDASTLEFLGQFLAEGLHDSILTLLTFRPEFTTPWPALAHQTTLALNRLTQRQVGDLMRTKMQRALPDAVVQQIYDRTGGVPLFVEEFTTMVQESALPDQEDGSSRGQTLLPHEIPATLQDLVMARLDRMNGERDVAQLASVLGREFGYELLDAVASLDETTLQAQLARLVQADILYSKGRPPRCTHIFKHALLEDALYNTLVKAKRQHFHRRIAEVLEAQFPQTAEPRPELLGHHFSEAGLAEKGAAYWLKAGLRSRERSAEVEAIGHLTKGLTLVGTLAASPGRDALELQLLNPLGTAYIAARGYAAPEVGPVFQRARELCERIGQPAQVFAVMWGTLIWHLNRVELGICPALADEAVAFAERTDDPGMLMEALFLPAVTSVFRGEFAAAQAHCTRALELDDRDRTRTWAAVTGEDSGVAHRCYLAIAMWHLGQPDRALRISQEAVALARAIGQPFTIAFALEHLATLCLQCRLAAEARATAEEEIAIATEQGFVHWLTSATLFRTDSLVHEGRWAEALPLFVRELDDLRATSGVLGLTLHLGFLGTAHTQAGTFADGARALDEALAFAEKTDERYYEPELHRLRGELHLAEANHQPTAEACFHTAIATARRLQSKAWELRATTSLARVWQRQGRLDEARTALATVYGSYTEGFTTPDLMDARALLDACEIKT